MDDQTDSLNITSFTESLTAEDEVLTYLKSKSAHQQSRPVKDPTKAVDVKFGMRVLSLFLVRSIVLFCFCFLILKGTQTNVVVITGYIFTNQKSTECHSHHFAGAIGHINQKESGSQT